MLETRVTADEKTIVELMNKYSANIKKKLDLRAPIITTTDNI